MLRNPSIAGAAPEREYVPFPNQGWRNTLQARIEIPVMARALRLPRGARMLEVGCGRGVGLVQLAKSCHPAELTGLDIDPALLHEARARLRLRKVPARCHHGDLRALPFAASAFDVVVDFGTCYHVGVPAAALAEIERVLRPGGLFAHESPAEPGARPPHAW